MIITDLSLGETALAEALFASLSERYPWTHALGLRIDELNGIIMETVPEGRVMEYAFLRAYVFAYIDGWRAAVNLSPVQGTVEA